MTLKTILFTMGCGSTVALVAACSSSAPPAQQNSPAPTPSATPTGTTTAPPEITPTPTYPADDAGLSVLPGTDGGIPGQCNVNTGRPNCDTCIKSTCCTQVNACDLDPDCVAADDCTTLCAQQYAGNPTGSQQCQNNCLAQHPVGGPKLGAVYQCVQQTCLTQCQ